LGDADAQGGIDAEFGSEALEARLDLRIQMRHLFGA